MFRRFDLNFKMFFEVIKIVKPILRVTQHSTNPWCQVLKFLTNENNLNTAKTSNPNLSRDNAEIHTI